jgi:hypothetical protein
MCFIPAFGGFSEYFCLENLRLGVAFSYIECLASDKEVGHGFLKNSQIFEKKIVTIPACLVSRIFISRFGRNRSSSENDDCVDARPDELFFLLGVFELNRKLLLLFEFRVEEVVS